MNKQIYIKHNRLLAETDHSSMCYLIIYTLNFILQILQKTGIL